MGVDLAIKKAYFKALNGKLDGVPIYDAFAIPETVQYPYVILSQIDVREDINQSCRLWRCDVTLDVVTGFSSPTGMGKAYEIGEKIESIINPLNRKSINITGYKIGTTRLTASSGVQLMTNNYWIYRNVRTYSHVIW